jgi:hypothetical protein
LSVEDTYSVAGDEDVELLLHNLIHAAGAWWPIVGACVDGIAHGVRCPWRPYLNKIYMVLGEAIAKLCPSCPQCIEDLCKIAMRDRLAERRVFCR